MKSIIKHNAYEIPAISIKELVLYTFTKKYMTRLTGYYNNDKKIVAELISAISDSATTAPFELKLGAEVKSARYADSVFMHTVIKDDWKSEISVKAETDGEDETDSKLKITWRIEDVLDFTDFSCWFNDIGKKEKKYENEVLNLRIAVSIAVEKALISRGIKINGITYKYLATNASGLKKGIHIYLSERAYDEFSERLALVRRLGKVSDGYNSFKDVQYITLLFTNASAMNLSEDFMNRGIVIDMKKNKLLDSVIKIARAYGVEKSEKMTASEKTDYEYKQNNTDGAMLLNSDYAAEYDMLLVQGRGAFIKFMGQFISFRKIAEFLGLTDEQCMITDCSGVKHDIREVSFILDKNTFKHYELYRNSGCQSYFDYSKMFGIDTLYACNIYDNTIEEHSRVKFTKQGWQSLCMNAEDIAEFAKYDVNEMLRVDSFTHEEYVEYVRGLYNGQAIQSVISLDVENGCMAYSDDALEKFDTARFSMFRESMNAFHMNGHMLVYFPDITKYFAALCGVDVPGLCLKHDAVYAKAFTDKEIIVQRSPVVAFDMWCGENLYREGNPANQFCNVNAMYTGWYSTIAKRTAGDWDGDKGAVMNSVTLIDCYHRTERNFKFYMVDFFEASGDDITEPRLKKFDDTDEQRACTIAYAQRFNGVGKNSAMLSCAFREVTAAMAAGDIERANKIYAQDIVPLTECNQQYVDSAKRGFAWEWNLDGSTLTKNWYDDSDNKSMPHKNYVEYNDVDKVYLCEKKTVDENGYEALDMGTDNFSLVHNYICRRVKAHTALTRTVVETGNGKWDFSVEHVLTPDFAAKKEEHPFDKRMFKQENRNYYLYLLDVTNEFGDMPYHSGYEAVARKLHATYTAKDMRRTDKVAVIRNLYNVLKNDNDNAYACMAQAYAKGIIGSEFFEMTSTETEEGFISDAALFVASEGKF